MEVYYRMHISMFWRHHVMFWKSMLKISHKLLILKKYIFINLCALTSIHIIPVSLWLYFREWNLIYTQKDEDNDIYERVLENSYYKYLQIDTKSMFIVRNSFCPICNKSKFKITNLLEGAKFLMKNMKYLCCITGF
jgi:hypothetical protein